MRAVRCGCMTALTNRAALELLLRCSVRRSMLAGLAVISAGIAVALIHFGADVGGAMGANQSGLLSTFAQVLPGPEGPRAILHCEYDDAA
jgi:hypothetical protein